MTHASLFSGIGGPEVAAAMLGWKNAFHCEINPFGRAVLDYWFPESKSYEDITKTDFKEWRGRIDVLTGGFPCQPFSYAGKRGGREDERYLWPQMLRAIDEIRPTWVVGENVAGLATMVEAGVLTDPGGSPSLFDEGDDVHGYLLRETFTIERICSDLERLGYSVQPVLIPAAAVGAPHRRDRIFILAHDADANRSDDERGTGAHERESVCEGVQERDEVRLAGVADQLRSEIQGVTEDAVSDGPGIGEDGQQRNFRDERNAGAGDSERVRGEERIHAAHALCWGGGQGSAEIYAGVADGDGALRAGGEYDASYTHCRGREESVQPGREENPEEVGAGMDHTTDRFSPDGDSSHAFRKRLATALQSGGYDTEEWDDPRRPTCMYSNDAWAKGTWWDYFPTVSPVHSRDDGFSVLMDRTPLGFSKWRVEAIKAYGNAIVPQVMYRIFQAIEQA